MKTKQNGKPEYDPNSIENLDRMSFTGRAGFPRPGCDCMWCFGYCMVTQDAEVRARTEALSLHRKATKFAADTLMNPLTAILDRDDPEDIHAYWNRVAKKELETE